VQIRQTLLARKARRLGWLRRPIDQPTPPRRTLPQTIRLDQIGRIKLPGNSADGGS
jgi:hypothetical protein